MAGEGTTQPFPVRLPAPLYEQLREAARLENVPMSQIAVAAIEEYLRHIRQRRTIERIVARHAHLRAKYGEQPDSTPVIRELRQKGRAELRKADDADLR